MTTPYAPPESSLDLEPTGPVRKPVSALVLQVIASLLALTLVLGAINGAHHWTSGGKNDAFGIPLGVAILIRLGMLAVLVQMIFSIQKGSSRGRMGGLLFILTVAILTVYAILSDQPPPADARTEAKVAFNIGTFLAVALVLAPQAYWSYAFGFSEKALRFFGKQDRNDCA